MTFGNLIDSTLDELNKAGICDARFDVYEIVMALTGLGYSSLEVRLEDEADIDMDAFNEAVNRLKDNEPVAYITGSKAFYREEYKVVPGVLIPRPDTEVLVEAALQAIGALDMPMGDVAKVDSRAYESVKIADLCTGSGCIGISVANSAASYGIKVDGILIDVSDTAINCAISNVKKYNAPLKVIKADILSGNLSVNIEPNSLDLLLSNPPYITAKDMEELDSSVKDYEPKLALYGGEDGMIFYSRLCELAKEYLKPGGALIVEHGYDQGAKVASVFRKYGFNNVTNIRDYGDNDRCVFGRM